MSWRRSVRPTRTTNQDEPGIRLGGEPTSHKVGNRDTPPAHPPVRSSPIAAPGYHGKQGRFTRHRGAERRKRGVLNPLATIGPMLKPENCRERQKRLLAVMEESQIDLAVITNPKTVYYFSRALVDAQTPHAFLLDASGKSVLVTHASLGKPADVPDVPEAAADEVLLYQHHRIDADVSPTSWGSRCLSTPARSRLPTSTRRRSVRPRARIRKALDN